MSNNYKENLNKHREEMLNLLQTDYEDDGSMNMFDRMFRNKKENEVDVLMTDSRISKLILGRLLLVEQAIMSFCLMSFCLASTVVRKNPAQKTLKFLNNFL